MPSSRKTKKEKANQLPQCARARNMPGEIHPMLATLVDEPFSNPEWLFETKWDGFRSVCFVRNGNARFVSRNQIEMTQNYPELRKIPRHVKGKEVILDGEVVALDEHGMPRFQLLQPRVGRKGGVEALRGKGQIVYFVFDLLYRDGYDLMSCPLIERKAELARILRPSAFVKVSEHIEGEGEEFFKQIARFHLEGMMAKRAASSYVQKRSSDWLKIKTVQRSEVVVGGYTQPRGMRSYFGALVVGLYRGDELRYVGHTGGGFNEKILQKIFKLMQPIKSDRCPFVVKPKTNEPVQWLKPKLVAEIKFTEWTADERMRHPIFVGLREDKRPEECRFEFERDTDAMVSRRR
jgi:bifunctional non-homologous end joining protein LigD